MQSRFLAQILRLARCTAAATALVAPLGATAAMQPVIRPLLQRPLAGPSHAPAAAHVSIGPHTRFGTIVRLQTNAFVMRTRTQRLLNVDDTLALQAGTYSFPLFPGKLVMVTGTIDASGIMHASTVSRMPALDPHTPADH